MIASAHRADHGASVLVAGNVASSPSSPCSGSALRAVLGGSGRSIALHCARWPSADAGDGQTGASGGGPELRVGTAEHNNSHAPGSRAVDRYGHDLEDARPSDAAGAACTGPAMLDRSLPRRSTVMSALPGLAQVILGYQSDSSSKRPGLSIALDLGTRVKPIKPPDPRIGALTTVAPYQLGITRELFPETRTRG